jgi:hypothetical protein
MRKGTLKEKIEYLETSYFEQAKVIIKQAKMIKIFETIAVLEFIALILIFIVW